MKPIVFNLFDQLQLADSIVKHSKTEAGQVVLRQFPDEEFYLQINSDVKDRDVIVIDSLDRPNHKILALAFMAATAKDLGAKKVGLIAPYLAYMRQDKRFNPGEGVTSKYFARLVSQCFDWLLTVDPHLHRYHNLSEIYPIPNGVVHAATAIAEWIKVNVEKPVLIGPDGESEQWVSDVAAKANAPYLILTKVRKGDNDVEISTPQVKNYLDHTPVLVDDIISTAHTMIETIKLLQAAKMQMPVCVGVHAVFAGNAYQALRDSGVKKIVTCNTIKHESNEIDVAADIVEVLGEVTRPTI